MESDLVIKNKENWFRQERKKFEYQTREKEESEKLEERKRNLKRKIEREKKKGRNETHHFSFCRKNMKIKY